jgi:predicted RNA binding protein YcfA (HicA-like mRNA interferase family)
MASYDKLVRQVLNAPQKVSFEDLDKILKREGCERSQPKGGSSHYVYSHADWDGVLTIPYRRPHVSKTYVKLVIEWLNLEERYGQ